MSRRSASSTVPVLALVFLLALLTALLTAPFVGRAHAETPSGARFESENPEAGEYRVTATGEVDLPIGRAVEILTAFDQHCAEHCRWPISSLDAIEIVESKSSGEILTWTRIDDVLDASYFQLARLEADGGQTTLVIETPAAEEIARLESPQRTHEPFFHRQRTVWTRAGRPGGGTAITVEMTMASDRFWINLAPGRILDGAEATLGEVFAHLEAAARAGDQPSD